MAIEKFSNTGVTTLSSSIDNSTTSVPVTSASSFPSTGNFRIRCGTEIMLVTSVSGSTFTVTRAQESTSAASHSSGATVYHVLSATSLNQFRLDNIAIGNYASIDSVAQAGRIYKSLDGVHQFQNNGTSWQAYGRQQLMREMQASDFTWYAQNGATSFFTGGTMLLSTTTNNSGHNIMYKPVTPPFTVTVNFINYATGASSFSSFNMLFFNTSTNTWSNIQTALNTANVWVWTEKWNANGSFNAEYNHTSFSNVSGREMPNWFRLIDDGSTSRTYQYSYDGIFFITQNTVARADYLTPNAVGVSIRKDSSDGQRKSARVLSWYQTSP